VEVSSPEVRKARVPIRREGGALHSYAELGSFPLLQSLGLQEAAE
jgi:hypothetical protein